GRARFGDRLDWLLEDVEQPTGSGSQGAELDAPGWRQAEARAPHGLLVRQGLAHWVDG
nr:hypothetical protein [Nocardioidaceae bacterium]